jgi:hypothetical protein
MGGRDGHEEFLTYSALWARYASAGWSPPHSFIWRNLSFKKSDADGVVVDGEFLLGLKAGTELVAYSYRAMLRRTGTGLSIRCENEARKEL